MGNPKPKIPVVEGELNTPAFRARVAEKLEENEHANAVAGFRKGDAGWLICSHADIAAELSRIFKKKIGQTQVSKLLGGARDGAPIQLILKSRYIRPIREMLGITEIDIAVPEERAEVLRRIAELPEKAFARHREAIESKKTTDPR